MPPLNIEDKLTEPSQASVQGTLYYNNAMVIQY